MHKVLLISGLALTLAGCATSREAPPPVQVQDLSASRAADRPASYTVEAGDTLYGIAWRHDMDYRDLARLNHIEPPYSIQPGQQLSLGGSASAGSGESGTGVSATAAAAGGAVATGLGGESQDDGSLDWLLPDGSTERSGGEAQAETSAGEQASSAGPGPVYDPDSPGADGNLSESDQAERQRREEREQATAEGDVAAEQTDAETGSQEPPQADAGTQVAGEPASNDSEQRTYTPVDDVPWQWPADGQVVGNFGEGGSITAGIDIEGQKGQPVKAAGPGIVVYAGSGVRGYGNLILLKHNDEFLSAYAHNDSLRVKENDVVETGEVIATMGDSDAEDVRLHFEVRKDGQPQDPLEYLPKR
ncbi:peptidoglycan DD-metalloendopeptidase family protein [Halomonas getboli]|uniref:peptidoglycan DD-metalloendopeptidase family protein n=1 Tax=Halomonas getboli TaxID=2935862 RepID=UPI001FFFE90F|nr:peptidoglycan DD-metalloendopeptidase family protein [Halomonas getboli]MCK2184465.1 peptidoglycan DD-metalloendopeptidase family protein [Halomonas getboli]